MAELDDNKTDKLFQVGAGRHDFEYVPAAWEQMEGLLDADDAARRRKMWLLAVGTLLALLLATGFGYRTFTADAGAPEGAIAATATTGENANSRTGDSAVTIPTEDAAILPPAEEASPSTKAIATPAEAVEGMVSGEGEGMAAEGGAGVTANELPAAPVAPATGTSPANATVVSSPKSRAVNAPRPFATVDLLPGTTDLNEVEAPEYILPAVSLTSESPHLPETPGAGTFRPGFAATLSAGLVSGTTSVGELGPRDTRFGAKLDYRFSNKLSVGLGGYYSNVCYNIEGTEYKAANASFPAGLPKNVESDCDVFEIPLSLTWHPHGSDRSGFYVGGGLTSYFLLTERFTFKYDEPVGPNAPRSWREDNANQHLFGMGQFNLGYQRKAGRRSAFQVETFVQLPLTDIGHGNVNLMTVGASVNYTFDFRRKRK